MRTRRDGDVVLRSLPLALAAKRSAGSVPTAVTLDAFPRSWLVVLFVLFWLGPGVFCNALFHIGASLASRTYCPGALTSVLFYLPLSVVLTRLAVREQLLSVHALPALCLAASALHALEVGHNVYKRW